MRPLEIGLVEESDRAVHEVLVRLGIVRPYPAGQPIGLIVSLKRCLVIPGILLSLAECKAEVECLIDVEAAATKQPFERRDLVRTERPRLEIRKPPPGFAERRRVLKG